MLIVVRAHNDWIGVLIYLIWCAYWLDRALDCWPWLYHSVSPFDVDLIILTLVTDILLCYIKGTTLLGLVLQVLPHSCFFFLVVSMMLHNFCIEIRSSSLNILASAFVSIESVRELEARVFDLRELWIFVECSFVFLQECSENSMCSASSRRRVLSSAPSSFSSSGGGYQGGIPWWGMCSRGVLQSLSYGRPQGFCGEWG